MISYDRAGYAHSDPSHDKVSERTSSKIVDELHELLTGLGLTSNLVLVGHSFGGTNVQLFASRYRKSVVGMVLVDSSHPDMLKKALPTPLDGQIKLAKSPLLARFLSFFGLTRLQLTFCLPKILPTLRSMDEYIYLAAPVKAGLAKTWEFIGLEESLEQVRREAYTDSVLDLPCVILSAAKLSRFIEESFEEDILQILRKNLDITMKLDEELLLKYPIGKLVVAEESDHNIMVWQPQLIVKSVHEVLSSYIRPHINH